MCLLKGNLTYRRRQSVPLWLNVKTGLADDGRLILRESGTEPLVRVTVEGRDADLIETLASDLADVVREVNQS